MKAHSWITSQGRAGLITRPPPLIAFVKARGLLTLGDDDQEHLTPKRTTMITQFFLNRIEQNKTPAIRSVLSMYYCCCLQARPVADRGFMKHFLETQMFAEMIERAVTED